MVSGAFGAESLDPSSLTSVRGGRLAIFRRLSHAALRVFVAVFRPVRGFFRDAAAVFLALGAALAGDSNSSLGCFAVRWWP